MPVKNHRVWVGLALPLWLSLSALACAGVNSMLSTPAPLPTPTLTATITPRPTATITSTATSVPTGVQIDEQRDGSTLITDYDNLYQMSLGPDWEVVPASAETHSDRKGTEANIIPVLAASTKTPEPTDTNDVLVLAVNRNHRYFADEYATNIQVSIDSDKFSGIMPLGFILAGLEDGLRRDQAQIVGKLDDTAENSHGVEIAKLEFIERYPVEQGPRLQVQAKFLLFQSHKRLIVIALWTLPRFAEELSGEMDEVADTIRPIRP